MSEMLAGGMCTAARMFPVWEEEEETEYMRKKFLRALMPVLALAVLASAALGQQIRAAAPSAASPKNVIVMIPDGMGPAELTLARLASGRKEMALDEHLIGSAMSSSDNRMVTDSGAAGTALASGIRTNNDYVGMNAQGEPVASVLEAAKWQRKMATGLVVTSRITYVTPATYSAHVINRDDEETCAVQQLALGMDVMIGGGQGFFLPANAGGKRKDNRDLLAEAKGAGYQVVTTREAFGRNLRMPVLALLTADHMHYEIDRPAASEPSLEEMTRQAIALLSTRAEGFFLMVEGSRIDHAGHVGDGGTNIKEVLAYDAAFAAAVEFARRDGNTLVVSVADHETGGLTINGGQWDTRAAGPLRLNAIKASAEKMVDLVRGGKTLAEVAGAFAGITNLTAAETAAYTAAVTGQASTQQARSIAALVKIINTRAAIAWASSGHSAVDVGVYAFGPGSEQFRGAHPSSHVATAVAELLKLDLAEATKELRTRMGAAAR